MSQQIQCPHCGQAYALTDEQVPQYAGQTITCTRCQKPFTVSMPAAGSQQPAQPQFQQPAAPAPTSPFPPAQSAPVSYAQGGYPRPQQTSGISIAALVCGLAGLVIPIAGLLGAILGIVGLRQTRDPNVSGRGLAIGGIIAGCITTLIWMTCLGYVIVGARQFPTVLRQATRAANQVKCAANLRQIGQAILLYSNDNQGAYPPNLAVLLTTQDITPEVFNCPDTTDTPAPGSTPQQQAAAFSSGRHLSYVYVGAGMNNTISAKTVVAYEPITNHNDGANFLWGDGHVSFESPSRAKGIVAQLNAGRNPPSISKTLTP